MHITYAITYIGGRPETHYLDDTITSVLGGEFLHMGRGGRRETREREKGEKGFREREARNEGDRKGEIYCMHCSTLVPYEFYVHVHVPLLLHTYMHMCVYTCTYTMLTMNPMI